MVLIGLIPQPPIVLSLLREDTESDTRLARRDAMTDVLAILGGILFLGLIAYGIWTIITWRKPHDPKEPWEKTGPGVGPG